MSAALERLKQHDARQTPPVEQSGMMMEVLTSLLTAVQAQNSRLDAVAERQQKLASYVKVMDEETSKKLAGMENRLRQLITPASEPAPSDSSMSETMRSELREIGQTLSLLAGSVDGKQIADAVSSLMSAKTQIEKTTAWNSEQATEFAKKYRQVLNTAGRAINTTAAQAVAAISESASTAAGAATQQIDTAVERIDAARKSAEHVVAVAERLQKPLGWSAAARVALTLLPVAVVLLMGVQSVWAVVVGVRWALSQDWELWLTITAGIGLAGLVAGSGFGLWRLTVWVKAALHEAAKQLERTRR